MAHGGGEMMVWADVSYGGALVDGILLSQRSSDEILRFIVLPHIEEHPLASILTGHPLSTFGTLWIGMDDDVFQFPPVSTNWAHTKDWPVF